MFSRCKQTKKSLIAVFCFSALLLIPTPPASASSERWVDSWAAATVSGGVQPGFHNITVREIVHLNASGKELRIKLSNVFNKESLKVGSVHIAALSKGSTIRTETDREVTFGGQGAATISANSVLLSDPVQMAIKAPFDLVISIYLPAATRREHALDPPKGQSIQSNTEPPTWITWHADARQTNYIAPGDQVASATLAHAKDMGSWYFLESVEVENSDIHKTVVAFGDSITDGYCSSAGSNHRYPDYLAARLRAGKLHVAIVNKGIGGNRLLREGYGPSALARFDRDVLAVPGVRYIILLEGINDIGIPGMTHQPLQQVTAQQLEAGMLQIIDRAHEHGIKVMGATLTPFAGSVPGYYSPGNEQIRRALNQWIRTSGAFDAVVDFDQALSNSDSQMRAELGCGDHLHPNDRGYKAMADAINLTFFKH